jgi:hypothetical protein
MNEEVKVGVDRKAPVTFMAIRRFYLGVLSIFLNASSSPSKRWVVFFNEIYVGICMVLSPMMI